MKGLMYKFVMAMGLLMANVTASATVTYVYTDPQGTPLAEADASGAITATFDYKPYGSQALGSPKEGPGYTGHVNDPDTGFVYMQARYYDSNGRFLSLDPLVSIPGNIFRFNRYAYGNDSPVINIDPTGKYNCDTRNNAADCKIIRRALGKIRSAAKSYAGRSPQAKTLNKILAFYGAENDGNSVSVVFGHIDGVSNGQTHYDENAGVLVKFDTSAMSRNFGGLGANRAVEYAATVAHEGQHGVDEMAASGDAVGFNQRYQTEYNAFMSQSYLNQAFHNDSVYDVWHTDWPSNFANGYRAWEVDLQAQCATSSSLCVAR